MRRLAGWIALYVAVLGGLAAVRWQLWTYGTDTGTFSQVIGDAFGGFRDGPEQGTHFRFHWAPMLATLAPLLFATRSALALQIAQVVLCGLTALPLYFLAREYVEPERARRYACLALIYPPLAGVAFTEFHEIAFYPAVALGLIYAAQTYRRGLFVALAIAAAGIREEACIVFAIVGVGLAVVGALARRFPSLGGEPVGLLFGRPERPRETVAYGCGLAFAGVAGLALYYGVVIPRVGPWAPSRFYDYPFAYGPVALVRDLVVHPQHLGALLTPGRLSYLLEGLVPLALLPLRSRWTLAAVPGLAVVLLSSDQITWRMGSHYAAIWIPWYLLASVHVLVRERLRERVGEPRRLRAPYAWAAGLCALFLVAFDPLHPAHYLDLDRGAHVPRGDVAAAFAALPADARVATHDEWFAHEAYAHRNATVFFCPYVDAAVYRDDYPNAYFRQRILPEIARELADGRMRVRARFGPVVAYERRPDPGARVGGCETETILPIGARPSRR